MTEIKFGDEALIKKLKQEEADKIFKENSVPCTNCHEQGTVYHDCDCQFCGEQTEECENCGGKGRVLKND